MDIKEKFITPYSLKEILKKQNNARSFWFSRIGYLYTMAITIFMIVLGKYFYDRSPVFEWLYAIGASVLLYTCMFFIRSLVINKDLGWRYLNKEETDRFNQMCRLHEELKDFKDSIVEQERLPIVYELDILSKKSLDLDLQLSAKERKIDECKRKEEFLNLSKDYNKPDKSIASDSLSKVST